MNGEEGFHFLFLEFSVGETLGVGRLLDLCSLSTGEEFNFHQRGICRIRDGYKRGSVWFLDQCSQH